MVVTVGLPYTMGPLQAEALVHDICTIRAQISSQHTSLNTAQNTTIPAMCAWSQRGSMASSMEAHKQYRRIQWHVLLVLCPRRMRACYTTTKALGIPSLSFVAAFCHVLKIQKLTAIIPNTIFTPPCRSNG
jgi:hypothetical protein